MTVTTSARPSADHPASGKNGTAEPGKNGTAEFGVPAPAGRPPGVLPHYRSILAVDIEDSTSRTDAAKATLRFTLYGLLEDAFELAGVKQRHREPFVDRGDGVLTLIRPLDEVPKTLLLHPFVPIFTDLLARYNARLPDGPPPRRPIRIRAVLHAGEVHQDRRGTFGEALDISFRLLDAPQTKEALRRTTSPLALVVSDDIYQSIVRHGYEGVHARTYAPLVQVEVAGRSHQGWVHTADGDPAFGGPHVCPRCQGSGTLRSTRSHGAGG